MRPEAIEPDEANEKAYFNHRPLEIEQAKPTSDVKKRRRKGRFWVLLLWAAIPTLLVTWFGSFIINDLPEQIAELVLLVVILPAAAICETLGFGQFRILGNSTVPDWLFFCVMIALVYLYSLTLVIIGRLLVRLVAGWLKK